MLIGSFNVVHRPNGILRTKGDVYVLHYEEVAFLVATVLAVLSPQIGIGDGDLEASQPFGVFEEGQASDVRSPGPYPYSLAAGW